ncbi:MAG TPA: sulfatase, partial [Thermoguttaceae bacterium]|nr:sulfatase [Thermoguttaceae bacterium]
MTTRMPTQAWWHPLPPSLELDFTMPTEQRSNRLRRCFLIFSAAVLGCLLPADSPRCRAGTPDRPNVLLIATDDLKPLLGCYGCTSVKTPNIDKLGNSGMVFLNNQCQQAVCGPTRASLLTGLRPDTTRVWDLATRMRDILPDVVTLPQYFKQNGYYTAALGKIFDGRCCDGWGTQDVRSWSQPADGIAGNLYAEPGKANGKVPVERRAEVDRPSTECADVPDIAYKDGRMSLRAIEEIEKMAGRDQPFFLAVGFLKPHLPFTAPKRYWDLYRRDDFTLPAYQKPSVDGPALAYHNSGELRSGYTDIPLRGPIPKAKQLELMHGYHATVSFVDAQIGRVLDALDELGLRENTIVVLWGDHGFHLG